jgi:hypothetical protein
MSVHDFNWSGDYVPTAAQVAERRERDVYQLRYLPYRILAQRLEIAVARQQLQDDLKRKRQLEKRLGKQSRSAWIYGDIIEQVEELDDDREKYFLLGQLVEQRRTAEREEQNRIQRNYRRRKRK